MNKRDIGVMSRSRGPTTFFIRRVISLTLFFLAAAPVVCPDSPASDPEERDFRQVHFVTTQGTQMSSDTFPDGRTLIFDLLGNLYLLSSDGGQARALTQDTHCDFWPAISPDGKRVAFVSDRNGNLDIWLANPRNGRDSRPILTSPEEEQSPAWLDTERLIFVQQRLGKGWIGIYHLSSEKTDWISCDGHQAISVSKGPANTILSSEIIEWHPKIVQRDLKDIGENKKGKQIISNEFDQLNPVVSPDGKWLAYVAFYRGKANLILRPFAGGEDIIVSPFESEYYLSVAEIGGPRFHFTPDGKELVFSYRGQLHRYALSTRREKPISMRAEVSLRVPVFPILRRRVEANRLPGNAMGISAVGTAPDFSESYALALGRLWHLKASGQKPVPLDLGVEDIDSLLFSPDLKHLAFTASRKAGEMWKGLWVADLKPGAGPPGRVLEKTVEGFGWAQDGRYLLAVEQPPQRRQESGKSKIVLISTENWRAAETVELEEKAVGNPQRFANGKLFAAIGDKRGICQLAEITKKGEAIIRTAFDRGVACPTVSPDESRLSFCTEEGIFWLPFPPKDSSRIAWHQVAKSPSYFLSWQVDGGAIVYYGDRELIVVSLEGQRTKSIPLDIPIGTPEIISPLYLRAGTLVLGRVRPPLKPVML